MKTVVGLLKSNIEARSAIQELVDSGFPRQAISIMASDESRRGFMSEDDTVEDFSAPETGFGVLSGGTDSLTKLGVLEEDASFYADGVERGGLLVAVSAEGDRAEKAADILSRHGAIDLDEEFQYVREEGLSSTTRGVEEGLSSSARGVEEESLPRAAASREREGVIPIVEEEIQVGKRQIHKGGVRVYSHISEVPVEEEISLREEHARVERRPADRVASELERDAFEERSFEVRETAEEPVISKQARVKEEVVIGTEASERTEVVRDTLRRTEVEVENLEQDLGRRDVSGMDDEEFLRHFNATYGSRGERFEETYRSAYHFAESESSSHPQLMNRDWPEVEEDIHRDWERTHPGTWSKVEEAIHYGWDRNRRH